jgi:hypothetical protein|tara:strand:- start:181 stop:456 length:276 start_codon:yes stop_codon:yes gene_type:complete
MNEVKIPTNWEKINDTTYTVGSLPIHISTFCNKDIGIPFSIDKDKLKYNKKQTIFTSFSWNEIVNHVDKLKEENTQYKQLGRNFREILKNK